MSIEMEHQWAYNSEEWRWRCICGSRGRWVFQSREAARVLGEAHVKKKHPTVTERI